MSVSDHASPIEFAPEKFRAILGHVRRIVAETIPDAWEMVAYNMPGFTVGGVVVASYAAFSKQCGLYLRPEAIAAHADEIAAAGLKLRSAPFAWTADATWDGPVSEIRLNRSR